MELSPQVIEGASIALHLIFYLVVLVFTIFTAFLVYHWFTYGTDKKTSTIALAAYLLSSLPFFIIMALSLTNF